MNLWHFWDRRFKWKLETRYLLQVSYLAWNRMEVCGCVMDMIRPWQYDLGMFGCVRWHDILCAEVKICLIICVILLNPPFMKRNRTIFTKSPLPVSAPRQGVEAVMAASWG